MLNWFKYFNSWWKYIQYSVSDADGNIVTGERKVIVLEKEENNSINWIILKKKKEDVS